VDVHGHVMHGVRKRWNEVRVTGVGAEFLHTNGFYSQAFNFKYSTKRK
jgi:hypothetical protein